MIGDVVENSAVATVDAPEGLSTIRDPGRAAAIWRRRLSPAFQTWIDGLRVDQLPKARVVVRPAELQAAARRICDLSGAPDCDQRDWLIDDAATLGSLVADLMDAPFVRLRFDVVTTNSCRKFHLDAITMRLVCTYRGTGTQYGEAEDGDPADVFTTPTGAPILLRGSLWPVERRSRLLHRSPPIEGSGETRLVLVIDPLTEPEREVR